jgi:hypothetical protein
LKLTLIISQSILTLFFTTTLNSQSIFDVIPGFKIPGYDRKESINHNIGVQQRTSFLFNYDKKEGEYIEYLDSKRIQNYDRKGNVIERVNYLSGGGGLHIYNRETWEYDSNGNETHKRTYDDSEIFTITESQYDENGNKIESKTYFSDDRFLRRETFTYNSENNNIQKNSLNKFGQIEGRTISKYRDKIYLVGVETYGKNGTLSKSSKFHWDTDNYLIGVDVYNFETLLKKLYIKYTPSTIIITNEESFFNEPPWTTMLSEFNFDGKLLKHVEYSSNGQISSQVDYSYGSHGNLTSIYGYYKDNSSKSTRLYYDKKNRMTGGQEFRNVVEFGETIQYPYSLSRVEYKEY